MNIWKPFALASTAALALLVSYSEYTGVGIAHVLAGNQPNMEAAKEELTKAIEHLNAAEHNKGGWRDQALKDAKAALDDVKRGIAFADDKDKAKK